MQNRFTQQRAENFERGGVIRLQVAGESLKVFFSMLTIRAQQANVPLTIEKDKYAATTASWLPDDQSWFRGPIQCYEVFLVPANKAHDADPLLIAFYNVAGALVFAMSVEEPLAKRLASVTTYGESFIAERPSGNWLCWAFRHDQIEALELFRAHFTIFEEFTELLYGVLNKDTTPASMDSINGLDTFVAELQAGLQTDQDAQEGASDAKPE